MINEKRKIFNSTKGFYKRLFVLKESINRFIDTVRRENNEGLELLPDEGYQ